MTGRSSSRRTAGRHSTGQGSFEPGFGCTIADAVVGSCSAYPFFQEEGRDHGPRRQNRGARRRLRGEQPYALRHRRRDGVAGPRRENVRVVSIGVGEYPPPKLPAMERPQVGQQMPTVMFAPKDDGDQHAVDGPAAQGAVPQGANRPHQYQIHAAGDGDGHAGIDMAKLGQLWQPRPGLARGMKSFDCGVSCL